LADEGYETGIDKDALAEASAFVGKLLRRAA
jgi:hypothetical protein